MTKDRIAAIAPELVLLAEAFGRRLSLEAAVLMAEALPKSMSMGTLKEASKRMLKEHDRFVLRDLLVIIDEVHGSRPIPTVKCEDQDAVMRRIRRELDIPEPGEELEEEEGDDE